MSGDDAQLTIGALSRATGVPIETLRTWERRYGVPVADRTASGHRRYTLGTVERIRLVTRVLELGHRPSTALAADVEALRAILAQAGAPQPPPDAGESPLASWFEHIERFESRAFERELRSAWSELGAKEFMARRVAPFLQELGERWADGSLGVRHEHFASERLREFLSAQWRPLSDAATGPTYLLATLPGERHVLGLHLAALTVVLAGGRVVFLGADAPLDEIAAAAEHHAAEAVLLSSAEGCDHAEQQADLGSLRAVLDPAIELRFGGRGFKGVREPAAPFNSLGELEDWLQQRARA